MCVPAGLPWVLTSQKTWRKPTSNCVQWSRGLYLQTECEDVWQTNIVIHTMFVWRFRRGETNRFLSVFVCIVQICYTNVCIFYAMMQTIQLFIVNNTIVILEYRVCVSNCLNAVFIIARVLTQVWFWPHVVQPTFLSIFTVLSSRTQNITTHKYE